MLSSAEAWGKGGRRGRMRRFVGNGMDERTERNGTGGICYVGLGSPVMFVKSHAMIISAFSFANGVK